MQSAPLGVRDGRDAMTAAMRSAATATTTGELLDTQTAAAAAAARFGLVGGLPFGPIMGLDPLPASSDADDRLADAARRIELLVGYTRNDGAPFVAMDPRIARLKRLGPLGCRCRVGCRSLADTASVQQARATTRRGVAQVWRSRCDISGGLVATACTVGGMPLHRTAAAVRRSDVGRRADARWRPDRPSPRRDHAPHLDRLRSSRCQRTRVVGTAIRIAPAQGVMASIAR